jgi:hypothetical protein
MDKISYGSPFHPVFQVFDGFNDRIYQKERGKDVQGEQPEYGKQDIPVPHTFQIINNALPIHGDPQHTQHFLIRTVARVTSFFVKDRHGLGIYQPIGPDPFLNAMKFLADKRIGYPYGQSFLADQFGIRGPPNDTLIIQEMRDGDPFKINAITIELPLDYVLVAVKHGITHRAEYNIRQGVGALQLFLLQDLALIPDIGKSYRHQNDEHDKE